TRTGADASTMSSIFASGTLKTSITASVDTAEVKTTGQAVIPTDEMRVATTTGRVLQADVRKAERSSTDRLSISRAERRWTLRTEAVARLVVQTSSCGSTPISQIRTGSWLILGTTKWLSLARAAEWCSTQKAAAIPAM